jgi:hypothetical protein
MSQVERRLEGGGRESGDSNVPQCSVDRGNARPGSTVASFFVPIVNQKLDLHPSFTQDHLDQ